MNTTSRFKLPLLLLLTAVIFPGISRTFGQEVGGVEFGSASFSGNETNSTIRLKLTRTHTWGPSFSVNYSTSDGSAVANSDYTPKSGVITIGPGQTNVTISISILNDSKYEGVEAFNVHLTNPSNGAFLATRSNTVVSIIDDESNSPGTVDEAFNSTNAVNGTINWIKPRAGEKILLGGDFSLTGASSRHGLAQLNSDGLLDPSFDPALNIGSVVNSASEANGKLLIAGTFTSTGILIRSNLARLLPNGEMDASFDCGTGANDVISCIATQKDGKIVVGGAFTTFNGRERRGCARLNEDGSLDMSFSANTDAPVLAVLIQDDGKVVISGAFTNVNGIPRLWLARVNQDGSVDSTFVPGGGNTNVYGTAIKTLTSQQDGKIIAAGGFGSVYGGSPPGICRFLTNGIVDTSFDLMGGESKIHSVAVQPDGKILIAGDFSQLYNPDRTIFNRRGLARLNKDGSIDASFNPGTGSLTANVNCVVLQNNLRVLACGSFTHFNGVQREKLVRLYGDIPTRIKGLNVDPVTGIELRVENEALRTYVIEASLDGKSWVPVATNTPSSTDFTYRESAAATNRFYRILQMNP